MLGAGFPQLIIRNSTKFSLKFSKLYKNSLDFAQISILLLSTFRDIQQ